MLLVAGCTAYLKGSFQLEREKYEPAIANFKKDLSKNPDHWKAREKLGFAYLKTGQFDKAIDEFTRVLQQKPKEPSTTYYLGLAYLNNGQRSQAIEVFQFYENKLNPLVEGQIKKQLTLLEMVESLHLAKKALADEENLKALPPQPDSVAVFSFKDISPDDSFRHLQKALAALIITDLSQVKSLQILERMQVQFLLNEMKLSSTGIVDPETAPRVGHLLGAENLIVGTLEPGSMAIKTSVASTTKKDIVGAFSVTATEEEFYVLQKEIVYNILKILEVSFTPEEEKEFNKYHTKNLKAVLYFGQGLDALDVGQWKEAKNFFNKAVAEDPEFELARVYREGCPDATASPISALSAMSAVTVAEAVDDAVTEAAEAQAEASEAQAFGSVGGPGPAGDSDTGSVSVSW
jgi:tetratricopeptide (TPR) repeat protein